MRPLLGTFVEIGARPGAALRAEADAAISAAFAAVDGVQSRLSFHDADSELSRLNRGGGAPLALSRLSLRVLALAQATMRASGALFDFTVGGLLVRRGGLPDPGVPDFLDRGTADDLELRDGIARLRRPVLLTLDGIAKGYAVDLAVQALKDRGMAGGWVNAGGDLRVFGDPALPVSRRGANGRDLSPLGRLRNAAIATSRVQAPGAEPDRDFPGLIVGTAPAPPAPGLVSVLARRAWRADALTKVAALAPVDSRAALLGRLGGVWVEPAAA